MFENVDTSRLSRDYHKFPFKKGELLNESDLRYLFEELNYSRDEVGKFFGVGATPIRRALTTYGIKKSPEQYLKKSNDTCLKKYGVKTPLNSEVFRAQIEKTNLEKYGVKNPFASQVVKEKIYSTNLLKYGSKNPQSCPEVKKRTINTLKQRYGISSGMQLHINHKDIWFDDEKLFKFIQDGNNGEKWRTVDLAEEFNISDSTVQVRIGELNAWKYIDINSSKYEDEIKSLLESWGCEVSKLKDGKFELDIVLNRHNLAIEFNGNYWHSTRVRPDTNYHKNKTEEASKRGYFLYHIFEYEWKHNKERIINHLRNLLHLNTGTIYARKCTVKLVDREDANKFLDKNHIQGSTNSSIRIGLYYNSELVSLMTFGEARFNNEATWELIRFCSKAGFNIVGGASKLFKYFIKTYNPSSVVSYSDITKTKGDIYSILGFSVVSVSKPRYVWVNHNTVYSRYQCQKKHLISRGWGTKEQTEKEIMESHNFFQIYDCGRRTHIWTRET